MELALLLRNQPLNKGHLSRNANFCLSFDWPFFTGLTVVVLVKRIKHVTHELQNYTSEHVITISIHKRNSQLGQLALILIGQLALIRIRVFYT